MIFTFGIKQEFLERQKQWQRYNAWQADNPDLWPDAGIDEKWNWYWEAWETARRLNPHWIRPGIDMEKIGRLQRMTAILAVLEVRDGKPQSGSGGNNSSP
ncbi:MAG TPA: hypothetical protein VMW83_15660 [Spirochaetia bacterium]|nr:hypothetical protein [Spirochaetia bacterium]